MNDEPYNIVGQKVALGPLKRELLGLYQRFMNDWPAAMWLGRTPMPITAEAELAWFERLVKSETDVAFTVYEKATGKPIGNAGLHGIQPINRNAEYGIALLEKECRGKGYGTETTRLVVDYGKDQDTGDRVIWANARLYRPAPPKPPAESKPKQSTFFTTCCGA